LEEVSEGGIPIDQPPLALSTPGHQETDVSLSQATTLSKSSSSPELQTLPEAFTKAAVQSAAGGDLLSSRIPTVQAGEREASGESVISAGPSSSSASVSVSSSSTSRMRLEFPTAQPGPLSPAGHRPRGHTISVSAPSSRRERKMDRDSYHNRGAASNTEKSSGLSPSFVFLQLYHSPFFGSEANKPLLLPKSQLIDRAVKVLDQMPPYDTHKIGVVFVGAGQANNEVSILSNEYGSNRYAQFLTGLGKLIHLKDCDPDQIFLGGLDHQCWLRVFEPIFHIATLMPNRESDKGCCNKKRHIGNDFVVVVYNDSGEEYKLGTIKGQFNFVEVLIKPLDYESNLVTLQCRKDLEGLVDTSVAKIVSDRNLPLLVRQMALHANLRLPAGSYHSRPFFGSEANKTPTAAQTQLIDRAVKVLDQMPPYDTHKIGVVFVEPGSQCWLRVFERYYVMPLLCDVHKKRSEQGAEANAVVVYNDSGEEYKLGTIKGQFNFVEVLIKPLDNESNLVTLQCRKVWKLNSATEKKIYLLRRKFSRASLSDPSTPPCRINPPTSPPALLRTQTPPEERLVSTVDDSQTLSSERPVTCFKLRPRDAAFPSVQTNQSNPEGGGQ
ncbi:hypothetical protein cypCar_00037671, partial [Cyprinus carpio]